jgi:hypothetical protein
MTAASVPLPWVDIPVPARRLLLHGSVGRDHLVSVARLLPGMAAGAAPGMRSPLLALAQDVLLAAFDEAPLDGSLASLLLSSSAPRWPGLPLPVADALKAVANFWSPPGHEHTWWRATGLQERQSLVRQGLSAEPRNLFWKHSAWSQAWPQGDFEQIDALLSEKNWPRTLFPVRQRFAAQAQLLRGDPHSALACLNACSLAPFWDDTGLRAECLLRMDRLGEAQDALRQSLLRSPWRVSRWLRLHDLQCGLHAACAPVPGPVAILLYTWNKAQELDETLASLAASDLSEARVWVLDNGSTDQTQHILAAWRERLGERLTVLRLPVNIGAPAARNWLLSLPEVRRNPYLVFLDDDVTLPADWLPRLGAALAAFPQASVWGCRVVDEANPSVVQSVDLTPVPVEPGAPPLALPGVHLGQPDSGQFSYLRPCVSVTGCCHLLREADIDRTGGFDIRFSPSQYDDLERDLRLGLSGGFVVYQGHLAVLHKRRSGAAAERSPAELGNATANTHKLLTKHSVEDLQRVRELGEALLERDLADKMERLAGV